MDIENIALVRATNIIPFEGKIKSINESRYITKKIYTELAFALGDLLKKQKEYNLYDETEKKEYTDKVMELMPYTSEYNSMVLLSLNGIVPDDMNNTFSNKTCAIIEDTSLQMEKVNFISLVPTDTAIKGSVELSEKSVVLIEKNRYGMLSDEEKEMLEKSKPEIRIFEGEVKDAVKEVLSESDKYHFEELSLERKNNGYEPSDTSEQTIETIDSIAKEYDIPQELHYNVITIRNPEHPKLEEVKDEAVKSAKVERFYQNGFFKYLSEKIDIDEQLEYCLCKIGSIPYMKELCDEIEKVGIDKYKEIVKEYNESIEILKEREILPTPEDIIESISKKEPIDLLKLVKEVEKEKETGEHSSKGDLKKIVYNNNLTQVQTAENETNREIDKEEKTVDTNEKGG